MDKLETSDPLVSIVIPFYDSYAPYLDACLDSVLRQTYTHWEVIVVDDASATDEGRAIVERHDDARLTIIRHERNRGQGAARNTGMRHSSGDFLMPLDCDDILAPTHVEKLIGAVKAHPECGAAYSDYRLFSAVSKDVEFPVRDTRALLKEQWIPHPGTIVRRILWEQTNGYCEDELFRAGNEDWDYFLSVAEIGLQAVRVPEPLYYYRQHVNSISSTRFACADYAMRERMYVRHKLLFDRFKMRGPFLAGGYRGSGKAFWSQGERVQALKLLGRAVWLDPINFARVGVRKLRQSHAYQLIAALVGQHARPF
jgi:glycosyltransferase involved in cell wall biosynthesis